ncbi:MAG TPA: exodeoxyribonuclease VII large subunit [Saprospiraceae bacterium]|nr:exodeoxyribonuclease VII large subunit [Saprospiraceae bacterium]
MSTLTLFALHEHLRRVMALNYPQPLWVTAEIAQVGQSRGHYYLDLVQKGELGHPVAQGQAVLWATDYRRIRAAVGPHADAVLREGLQVRLQVRVEFHERYGLKLQVVQLDPAYTFGELELQRQETMRVLREAGLLGLNRQRRLPAVLQRVAVVSSEEAAGLQDFIQHLRGNRFGYCFHVQVFKSAVQGNQAAAELQAALTHIAHNPHDFDCAAVIRGGGARLDLAPFDDIHLCRTAAQLPLPLLTGIGHETDDTVLDAVAHTALKTPTAVADFLIQQHLLFEQGLSRAAEHLHAAAALRLGTWMLNLERQETALRWATRQRLQSAHYQMEHMAAAWPAALHQLLSSQARHLDRAEAICSALHPEQVLRRGYTLTTRLGRPLRSAHELSPGDVLLTHWADGSATSEVLEKTPTLPTLPPQPDHH